jgi:hypothetical protein
LIARFLVGEVGVLCVTVPWDDVTMAILPRERIPVTADYIIQEENKDIILLITLHNALTRFEKFVPSSVEKV